MEKLNVAEVHNTGEEHNKTTLPTQNDTQPERRSSKNKERLDEAEGRFISKKICVRLLNSHRKETITTWLSDCGLPVPKKKKLKVHKLREQLLKYIQSIHDGKTKPTMFFASSFLGKLPLSDLLVEAKRLKIYFPKKAHETEIRRSINEYFTAEGEDETERPLLLTTDEELSPSESETEEYDSLPDEAYRPQKSPAKKSNGGDRGKVKQENPEQTKHVNKKRSDTGLSAKNSGKPEKCKAQHTEAVPQQHQKLGDKAPHSPYEKSILTLEQSLIEVQDRLSAQELQIESISNRSTLEQQTSALKSLQTKNRTFFDTLNTQQSSIDTLKDSLSENTKESKKRLKKFNQLQGTVTNNAKQGQEALAELKQDVHDWMKACEVMFTELRQQIEPLTKTTTQLQNEVKNLKQDLALLKSSGCTISDPTMTDSKEGENVINAQNSTSVDVALIAEIKKLREDNKAHFARLDKQLKSLASSNQTMTPSSKKENARTTAIEGSHGINSNQSKSSNTEMSATVPQNRKENRKIDQTGQLEREIQQRPRRKKNNSTSSSPSKQNTQKNPNKVTSRGAISGESKCDNASEPTKQADEQPHFEPGRKVEYGKSTSSRFATRKCLVIHDPYFRGFDESKFSRWFDVTTAGFESLKHVVTSKTLPSKVKTINPEVIFLHVGQADLLDKESGDTVLQEFKKFIKNILTHTSAKLCVSQMIPTGKIPQVDSVIKQVNKELSNHISKLRTEDTELRKRVFSCNNDSLASCITQSVGKHGIELSLNDRGQRKLWLNLRDGLNRSLSLNHPKKKESDPNTRNSDKTSHRSRPDNV